MEENGQFSVLAAFTVQIGLELGEICKNNDHTCLFHCINTCGILGLASYSNSFQGTRQMLMHEKNMYDPYISIHM